MFNFFVYKLVFFMCNSKSDAFPPYYCSTHGFKPWRLLISGHLPSHEGVVSCVIGLLLIASFQLLLEYDEVWIDLGLLAIGITRACFSSQLWF